MSGYVAGVTANVRASTAYFFAAGGPDIGIFQTQYVPALGWLKSTSHPQLPPVDRNTASIARTPFAGTATTCDASPSTLRYSIAPFA